MNPQPIFSTGDLVRLKTGGPDMVVQPVIAPYQIKMAAAGMNGHLPCQSWDGNKFVTQLFDPSSLSLVTAYVAPATPLVFIPGAIVQNKAGGPPLTVEPIMFTHEIAYAAADMNDFLPCRWNIGKGPKSDGFHPSALT